MTQDAKALAKPTTLKEAIDIIDGWGNCHFMQGCPHDEQHEPVVEFLKNLESAQVRDEGEPELETPEEKRRRYRITAVILKNLPISSLDFEELKLYTRLLIEENTLQNLEVWCAVCQENMLNLTGDNDVKGWYRCKSRKHEVVIALKASPTASEAEAKEK